MPCVCPIHVKPKKGAPPRDGFSFHSVPCGKCSDCRLRRIQGWVFRLRQEMKVHQSAYFVTLTYDVPIRTPKGFMTLTRGQDGCLTKFFKRLRYNTGRKNIKYYACGEYGSKTNRPHYHLIIFDVEPEDIELAWSLDGVSIGHCHFGKVSSDSIAYCAKYCAKDSRIPLFPGDDRLPEFSVMSKGLGKNYLTPAIVKYHRSGLRSYLTTEGGFINAMPRYYRDRLFDDHDREFINDQMSIKFDHIERKALLEFGYDLSQSVDSEWNRDVFVRLAKARFESGAVANKAFVKNSRNSKI